MQQTHYHAAAAALQAHKRRFDAENTFDAIIVLDQHHFR